MITQEVAREYARKFRADVYGTFQKRADAVFELIDTLSSDTQARSPVELSLSPFFRHQYSRGALRFSWMGAASARQSGQDRGTAPIG